MSALDQAFIRAYVRHGAAPAPAVLDSARPVQLAESAGKTMAKLASRTSTESERKSRAEAPRKPGEESPKRLPAQCSRCKSRGKNGAAAQRSTAKRQEAAEPKAAKPADAPTPIPRPDAAKRAAVKRQRPLDRTESEVPSTPRATPGASVSAETLFSPGTGVAEIVANGEGVEGWISEDRASQATAASRVEADWPAALLDRSRPSASSDPTDVPAQDASTPTGSGVFRPMLEVDRFLWPTVVGQLETGAGSPLEPLTDALIHGAREGRKVVAVVGCHRGDGCTTLVLAAARRLAREGLRLALADADFEHPHLAKRLGLAPQWGWEEVLCGRVPLGEVAIESLQDRMVLLPVCKPPAGPEQDAGRPWDAAAVVGVLCERYDLVLLDLGRLHKRSKSGIGSFDSAAQWIDAAVLVYNVRSASDMELVQAHERLRAAGIADVLVVENFA